MDDILFVSKDAEGLVDADSLLPQKDEVPKLTKDNLPLVFEMGSGEKFVGLLLSAKLSKEKTVLCVATKMTFFTFLLGQSLSGKISKIHVAVMDEETQPYERYLSVLEIRLIKINTTSVDLEVSLENYLGK